MRRRAGFTLIEVIATMVLVGIMAAVAGVGGASYVKGYIIARDNRDYVQKAEIAMARISRELRELKNITLVQTSPTRIRYTRLAEDSSTDSTQTLEQVGDTITLNGDTLLDNVPENSFTLSYFQGSSPWTYGNDIEKLSGITVSLSLTPSIGSSSMTFATTLTPRNNGNVGGEVPPHQVPPAYSGSCFVATAAYGNVNHPVVVLLREFRDRCLNSWSIGRRIIDVYYCYGPTIADIIRDRPWACFGTRLLLAPIAGTAFLIIHFPAVLPVVLLLSWVAARFLLLAYTGMRNRRIYMIGNQSGSVLVMLIAVITILAILGTGMVTFLPTSIMSQMESLVPLKAYYMAESGYRYAAGQFQSARGGDAVSCKTCPQFQKMEELNDMNGTKARKVGSGGQDGKFELQITPYFLVLASDRSRNSATLQLKYPGSAPSSSDPTVYSIPTSGIFDIDTDNSLDKLNLYHYDSYTESGGVTTFNLTSFPTGVNGDTDMPAYTSVRFVAKPASTCTVNEGGNLTLATGQGGPFSPNGGTFTVYDSEHKIVDNTVTYTYASKDGNILKNINVSKDSINSGFPLSLQGGSDETAHKIVCKEYVSIKSIGKSYASNGSEISRTITFYTPIGSVLQPTTSITEKTSTMANPSEWSTASSGTLSFPAADASGNRYMQLSTGDYGVFSDNSWGLVAQNMVNFASAWTYASHLLNYDAQVKIDVSTYDYYLAGISFRIQTAGDGTACSYGLSFLRSYSGSLLDLEGIPDDLVPTNASGNKLKEVALVVLWRRSSSGYKWLAYKRLNGTSLVNSSDTHITAWSTLLVRIKEEFESGNSGSKYNMIRCYYATPTNSGTGGNSIRTDENRAANSRWPDTVSSPYPYWPSDPDIDSDPPWTADTDQYTLIDWDRVNTNVDDTVGAGAESGCIIKDSVLTTPSSGVLTTPEVGLHSAGKTRQCGLLGCYLQRKIDAKFDDFGIRYQGSTNNYGFSHPIQQ